MTDDQIRFEYWWQLNERLDAIQDEMDYEEMSWANDYEQENGVLPDWFRPVTDFLVETFTAGRLEFRSNEAVLCLAPGHGCGADMLQLLNHPTVCWTTARVEPPRVGEDFITLSLLLVTDDWEPSGEI